MRSRHATNAPRVVPRRLALLAVLFAGLLAGCARGDAHASARDERSRALLDGPDCACVHDGSLPRVAVPRRVGRDDARPR